MNFIKILTDKADVPIFLNADHIETMSDHTNDTTVIQMVNGSIYTTPVPPEDILAGLSTWPHTPEAIRKTRR